MSPASILYCNIFSTDSSMRFSEILPLLTASTTAGYCVWLSVQLLDRAHGKVVGDDLPLKAQLAAEDIVYRRRSPSEPARRSAAAPEARCRLFSFVLS